MKDEMLKIIGIIVIIGFLVFLATKTMKLHMKVVEGLTNSTTDPSASSEAGSAANYASTLKNQVVQLQDTMLISKYRKDYETVVLNMDDYVNVLMLQSVLSINPASTTNDANMAIIKTLNELNNSKIALNNVMKYIDSS